MSIYGIDVSHHQGRIDWARTAAELRRVNDGDSPGFAIIRIGYSSRSGKGGLVLDGEAMRNLKGCAEAGVPCGVYWYCYDATPEAAAVTAEQVVQAIKGYRLEYPVFMDMEYGTSGQNGGYRYDSAANKATNTAMIAAALQVLEQAGYYAAVYCSRDFFQRFTNLAALAGFDKWEAAYTKDDTAAIKNGIWQYSSSNALGIAGFGKSLDCDVAYKDYPAVIRAAGLNGLAAGGGAHGSARLRDVTVLQASEGDVQTVIALAERLGLKFNLVTV